MKEKIRDTAGLILALLLTIGSVTFIRACDSAEGRHMACHWAQNSVTLIGIVLLVQSLAKLLIRQKAIKAGLSIGIAALAISVVFIPGTAINLCMMKTMRCHTVFRPAVAVVSSLLAIVSVTDTVTNLKGLGKEK